MATAPWSTLISGWVNQTITSPGQSDILGVDRYNALLLLLTIQHTSGGLSIYIQSELPAHPGQAATWMDIVASDPITTSANLAVSVSNQNSTNGFIVPTDGTLTVPGPGGTFVNAPLGRRIRLKWVTTGTPNFTLLASITLLEKTT